MKSGFLKNSGLLYYALAMGILLVLMHWLEFRFLFMSHSFELYAGAIALIFTLLGIWLAKSLLALKQKSHHKDFGEGIQTGINLQECSKAGISKREMEVLERMAKGYSNAEIASELFVSLNTVKTHVSSILSKLNVVRRTQAVEKAKRLGLLSN